MTNQNVQPIFILPEGTLRSQGRNAQKANISAAKAVADTVRTTLGPKGMDKMLVDSIGDVVITNDGVTILNEMEIEHPAAKMMVEIAKVQEDEVGDGTTTAVVLGGELLKNAESLLEKNIHPTVIANGYKQASEKAQAILNELSKPVSIKDTDVLKKIAMTAMTGKNVEIAREKLAQIALDAVLKVAENSDIDRDDVKLEKKEGGGIDDSQLIDGVVIDKEKVHADMPKSVKNATIALLDCALEIKETETEAKIQVADPKQLQAFLDQEEKMLKNMVETIVKSGATVVFCQKGIDDIVQHYLAKKEIYAARRVKESDMKALAKATGARIIASLNDLKAGDLGKAGLVEERKLHKESMTFVERCKNPKSVTILLRGGTEHVVAEVERAMTDAIGDLIAAIIVGKFVVGGGAVEIELAKRMRSFAETLSGREQLAVQAFADSLEVIPRTLAENAGLDPIDSLTELKAKHDKGEATAGLNVTTGRAEDMLAKGVIEPLKIKTQAIQSASEAAIMLLRIDDVISASKLSRGGPPGMHEPGQMGGEDF
ncbi:MAG: TCP-1/cpn60 chaperonin family protein [DPANN group archaeon]|nr:TCP-1/cpn60 chaperonin family protein [DPANN group archaeon]